MAAVLGTLENYSPARRKTERAESEGSILTWLTGIFGCTHKELSRPFSRRGQSYRVCTNCGAQRRFDQETWNMRGPFYFEPANTRSLSDISVSAVRAL